MRDPATVSAADPRLVAVQLDVTDADRVTALADELADVELVVNNAGIAHPATPLSAGPDAARAELEANYLALIAMTQAFAPVLAANGGGAFVNVLSVASWVASPMLSTYSASKAAAWSFTNSARVELKHQGTHVVGVHVGFVDTDLTAALTETRSRRPQWPPPRSTPSRPANPRRSSTSSAAGSRPASATTSARCTRRSSATSRPWSGARRDRRGAQVGVACLTGRKRRTR